MNRKSDRTAVGGLKALVNSDLVSGMELIPGAMDVTG